MRWVVEKGGFFDHPGRAYSARACRISWSQDADVRDVRPPDPPTGPWAVLPARPSDNAYVRRLGRLLCRTVESMTVRA